VAAVRDRIRQQRRRQDTEASTAPGAAIRVREAVVVTPGRSEGHGRSGRDRLHFWRIAYASAKEVDSHLRRLAHAVVVNRSEATKAIETFDEVRAITWRLLNPKSDI
jgi:four helix bundle protein